MIIRVWRAQATPEGAEEYRKHFERSVMTELGRIKGFRKAYLLNRRHDQTVDIEVHTLWESLDVIRAFAGDDLDTAVVEPEAIAAVITYEKTVSHFTAKEYEAVTAPALSGTR